MVAGTTLLGMTHEARRAGALVCRAGPSHTSHRKGRGRSGCGLRALAIDLIPDIVPILGYLDDVVIVPLGVLVAVRLIPVTLMAEFREVASRRLTKPTSRAGLVLIPSLWVGAAVILVWWFGR